jgi:hypothetical protein
MHGSLSAQNWTSSWFTSLLVGLLAIGCGASSDGLSSDSGGAGGSAGAPAAGSAGAPSAYREPSAACRAPAGVSNNPQSISETITLLNSLPKPLSIPCFLESLARPLPMVATFGVLSAQPAMGIRSPRLFLFFGPNRMSIVPDGVGANALEFGEVRPDNRSLKGQIDFPLTGDLPPGAAFEGLMFNDQVTTCGLCHGSEESEPSPFTTHSFVSNALRPAPRNAVSLQSLRHEFEICNRDAEPYRCAMLDSLFSLGPVVDAQFPTDMLTFE